MIFNRADDVSLRAYLPYGAIYKLYFTYSKRVFDKYTNAAAVFVLDLTGRGFYRGVYLFSAD